MESYSSKKKGKKANELSHSRKTICSAKHCCCSRCKQKTKGDIDPLDYDYDEDEDEDDNNATEEEYETEDDAESEDDVK